MGRTSISDRQPFLPARRPSGLYPTHVSFPTVLDIFAVMGGCEIIVPSSWTIVTPLVPVMGGIDDKRLAPLPGSAENIGGKPAPRLVLRGLVLMGGIEIKS